MVDACRLGICELYSTGGQPLGLIVGATIGAIVIAVILRRRKRRKRDD